MDRPTDAPALAGRPIRFACAVLNPRDRLDWTIRWSLLVVLLFVERYAIIPWTVSQPIFWKTHSWVWIVPACERGIPAILIAGLAAAGLIDWSALRDALRWLVAESAAIRASASAWLAGHLLLLVLVVGWAAIAHNGYQMPAWIDWESWIWIRLALEMATLAAWIFAALPPPFWGRWFNANPTAFAAGAVFGLAVKIAGHYTETLWWLFRNSTYWMVAALLHGLGQRVIVNSATGLIGTPAFSAQISNGCSGLEGISLMFGFVAIYLWCYRRELRFPQALVLLPIGIGMVWILNAVRITALLMIGSINGRAAVSGFHSVAGWLSLSIVGCGLVILSWRVPAFTRAEPAPEVSRANPAGLYLVPLLTIIAVAMVTRVFYPGFDFLYPLRVAAAALALWFYRRQLGALGWGVSVWAVALGVLVFAIWMALAPAADPRFNATFAADLNGLSFWTRNTWLFFRVLGAVVTVPIAEELAFRGYLMRKLIAEDFTQVPMGRFTWVSFLGSSILFGAMHSEWIAGIVAGMLFAVAVCRRGRLTDAIGAHAISNALLAIYVLTTHNWSLWT